MIRMVRRLTLPVFAVLAASAAGAGEPEEGAHKAADGVTQTRKLLDVQRDADAPPTGMTARETRRILENYIGSIGKGGGGAPLPDPPSTAAK